MATANDDGSEDTPWYSRTSILNFVNEARMDLYFTRTQNIETIPPTKNALFLHTKRALYQSGVWSKCLEAIQNLPSPKNFGWKDSGEVLVKWVPHWTTEAEASKECREFVKCACTTVCGSSARCTCKGADFKCTLLFKCKCTDKLAYD